LSARAKNAPNTWARAIVAATGYHRRDAEVAELKWQLGAEA
jgi:phage terminase large subunit-like protein